MNYIFRLMYNLFAISLVVSILMALGVVTNSYIPWTWLTDFFSIIKSFSYLFNFTWDIPTAFTIVGIIFAIEVAYWAFKAGTYIIKFFK